MKLLEGVIAYPILYTDVLREGTEQARQVCRDDMWAVSTSELNRLIEAANKGAK